MDCLFGPQISMRRPVSGGAVISELQKIIRKGDASELVDYLNIEYQIDPRNVYFSDGRSCLTEVRRRCMPVVVHLSSLTSKSLCSNSTLRYLVMVDSTLPTLPTPHISNPIGEQ